MNERHHRNADKSMLEPVTSDRIMVNKANEAKRFSGQKRKTKAVNVAAAPMRGGWRL